MCRRSIALRSKSIHHPWLILAELGKIITEGCSSSSGGVSNAACATTQCYLYQYEHNYLKSSHQPYHDLHATLIFIPSLRKLFHVLARSMAELALRSCSLAAVTGVCHSFRSRCRRSGSFCGLQARTPFVKRLISVGLSCDPLPTRMIVLSYWKAPRRVSSVAFRTSNSCVPSPTCSKGLCSREDFSDPGSEPRTCPAPVPTAIAAMVSLNGSATELLFTSLQASRLIARKLLNDSGSATLPSAEVALVVEEHSRLSL